MPEPIDDQDETERVQQELKMLNEEPEKTLVMIELLETALALAKKGDLRGLAIVTVDKNLTPFDCWVGPPLGSSDVLSNAIELLSYKHDSFRKKLRYESAIVTDDKNLTALDCWAKDFKESHGREPTKNEISAAIDISSRISRMPHPWYTKDA